MSVSSISSSQTSQVAQAPAQRLSSARDNDGDEAGESSTKRAQEAAAQTLPLPVNQAKGRNVNILA